MKSIADYIIKLMFSTIISVVVLSLLVCFYLVLPVHVDNPNGNTDYVWPANSVFVNLSEGMGYGKHDALGYNNLQVINNPDILVLGSSHMEGHNVMPMENTVYVLQEKLGDEFSVYNMAISGHNFYKTCQYIPNSLDLFERIPSIVIVETSVVDLDKENIRKAIDGTLPKTSSSHNKIITTLQSIPFFRLVYHQIEGGLLDLFLGKTNDEIVIDKNDFVIDEKAYEDIFVYLSKIEKVYNTEIIIFYHPTGELREDGSLAFEEGKGIECFANNAMKQGINFIDMAEDFKVMYEERHLVPHGFANGELESGHINKYGHIEIANRLSQEILSLKEKSICQ